MTVTIVSKQDILAITDNNDNETCYLPEETCGIHHHSESLQKGLPEFYSANNEDIRNEEKTSLEESEHDKIYYEKSNILVDYEDAPEYMKYNSYIRTGYRRILKTDLCIESIFWWTNETINIWSHILGLMLFVALAIYDLMIRMTEAPTGDKILVGSVLICFQACMASSSLYHIFSCRSEEDYHLFLSFDMFGVALALLGIDTSVIYYAFWCDQDLQNFYLSSVTLIFILVMTVQTPKFNVHGNVKMIAFVAWAAYGVVPSLHWAVIMGGFQNPVVSLLLPRIFGMYAISVAAFFIYVTKIPERFSAGKFDFIGHSHQWWHLFIVGALYYWHNTFMLYVDYRLNHACANTMTLL